MYLINHIVQDRIEHYRYLLPEAFAPDIAAAEKNADSHPGYGRITALPDMGIGETAIGQEGLNEFFIDFSFIFFHS